MALKHNGQCLTHKERNKLKHALNGNMALQMACICLATTGLTFLMRRNRAIIIEPTYNEHRILTGAQSTTAIPTVPDLAEETAAADMVANVVGGNIATVINEIRTQNETFQRTIAREREMFLRMLQTERIMAERTLATERQTYEERIREETRERPQNPELKIEPPKCYEGEPAEIDTWIH